MKEVRSLATKRAFERLRRFASAREAELHRAQNPWSCRTIYQRCTTAGCNVKLEWKLRPHRLAVEFTRAGVNVGLGAGVAAAVGWLHGHDARVFATLAALGGTFWEATLLRRLRRGLVQCRSCRRCHCFDCGAACSEDAASCHRCASDGDAAFQAWAASVDAAACPSCGQLIERASGCNHMRCRCGQNFCWACGTGYARGGTPRCRCSLYGSRLFAATSSLPWGLEETFILLGISVALPDCGLVARKVAKSAPWALALVPLPAALRLHGWNRASATWLALAFAAEGTLPPLGASLFVALGMAATLWAKSRHQRRDVVAFEDWETFGPILRSLPMAVAVAIPACTIWVLIATTRAIALLESLLQRLMSEDGSVPVAMLPLAAVVILLVGICLPNAFFFLWHAIGLNWREDAEFHPNVSLFNCMQVVALQVLAVRARLSARWVLQGAFEWGLLIAVGIFWTLIVAIVYEYQSSATSATRSMVVALGGPRLAAAQAVALSVAFAAASQLHFLTTCISVCLQLLAVHLCWLRISRSNYPSLLEPVRFTIGSLLNVLIMLVVYGVPGASAAVKAFVASRCAIRAWLPQDTRPWTAWA